MTGLVLQNITITLTRNRQNLVSDLSLSIEPGQIQTVMGASGAGKSSLLAFISGHLDPAFTATGRIWCQSREVSGLPAEQRRLGILFQDDMLFPHLSVGANLLFGLEARIKDRAVRHAVIEQALSSVGLQGFAGRDPATLSGGQRIRVALIRTLLSAPDALLLDEPFSKLDTGLRAEMRDVVFSHVRDRKLPVLMVTHDEEDASTAGGPVLRMG